MPSQLRSFSVGDIQCIALNDGIFNYPTDWLFSNVDQNEGANFAITICRRTTWRALTPAC